jgi:hypothetical protein
MTMFKRKGFGRKPAVVIKRWLKLEWRWVVNCLDWRFVPFVVGLFVLLYLPAYFGWSFNLD